MVKTKGLKLPPHGVFVVWKWEWTAVEESESEEEEDSFEQHNPHLHSNSEQFDSEHELDVSPAETHTVTFKCIGSVHDNNAQEVLSRISSILCKGGEVDVRVNPEQDNKYDSQAIAFQCYIDSKWQRIGYVVKECVSHVHKALQEKRLLTLKIKWAKYLVCWKNSGPGFYAGIDMCISGKWHRDVIKGQSTK